MSSSDIRGQFVGATGILPPLLLLNGAVLNDIIPSSGWSGGAQAIQVLGAQPTLNEPWVIDGWSVQAQGALFRHGPPPTLPPTSGLLGKLYASLLVGSTLNGSPLPPTTPFAEPPLEALQNLVTLWDGSQDPPFPWLVGQPPVGGYVQATSQLPQPQQLLLGEQMAIGLWLSPSLVTGVQNIVLFNVQFAISYHVDRPQ